MKKFLLVIVLVIIVIFSSFVYLEIEEKRKIASISSFAQCKALGYPLLEKYPSVCTAPDGRTFTQDIGNELEMKDSIEAQSPRPGDELESPFRITGKARGRWFFEGFFFAKLYDENGTMLNSTLITAQDDWMSDEFVPFDGSMEYFTPETENGKLILNNANPSALPENDLQLIIPVKLK